MLFILLVFTIPLVLSFQHNAFLKNLPSAPHTTTQVPSLRKFVGALKKPSGKYRIKDGRNRVIDSILSDSLSRRLPVHPDLVEGTLDNGLSYVILPNANPPGRFEAHLEILSGSIHELDHQQGMAHLVEHCAFMGSSKRHALSGSGSKTNAYTDFHHTVFYAACPTQAPDTLFPRPMMPLALDALLDVMTCRMEAHRLEKEKAAVLSEATMVNTMEHRVECQILAALHRENRVCSRFPIGKEEQIRQWTTDDLQAFHSAHYRPDNAVLYVVGDVSADATVAAIQGKFGHLRSPPRQTSRDFPEVTMSSVNKHFPPVVHRWSVANSAAGRLLPPELVSPALPSPHSSALSSPTVFAHDLLKSFSFHLFAKRPIEPVTSEEALRRELLRRLVLTALQIRLNVDHRQTPLFTMVDANQVNWPREGCAVFSLDLTADVSQWETAVRTAIREVRRLGLFGLTAGELVRFKSSLLSEGAQMAAHSAEVTQENQLMELMEHQAAGHTLMHPQAKWRLSAALLESVTLGEVNAMARELCEHVSHVSPAEGVEPAAIVACTPTLDRTGRPSGVTEQAVSRVVREAIASSVEPLEDTPVPDSLMTHRLLREKLVKSPPRFVEGMSQSPAEAAAAVKLNVTQRRLSNGIRVNIKPLSNEPHKMSVRLYVPGGRLRESVDRPGSVLLGGRTIQEGGAFLNMTREQVELFCIDHMLTVEVTAAEDALVFDLSAPTTSIRPGQGGVTGAEAALQVAHVLLTDFAWEEDAFERARQAAHERYDSTVRGLESACQERVREALSSGGGEQQRRAAGYLLQPTHEQLQALDLAGVRRAVRAQLRPDRVEVSLCGDLPLQDMETLALAYLGSVPPAVGADRSDAADVRPTPLVVGGPSSAPSSTRVLLADSEERAMAHLAGAAPNPWGVSAAGETLGEQLARLSRAGGGGSSPEHRLHPAFGLAALKIVEELASRRLFSVVREERQLTYDANFRFEGSEGVPGGYYQVYVTSSPAKVDQAVEACKEALSTLATSYALSSDNILSCKRALLQKFQTDSSTNKFWVSRLSGTQQQEHLPLKTLGGLADFERVVNSVTSEDVRAIVDMLRLGKDRLTVCVGTTAPEGV